MSIDEPNGQQQQRVYITSDTPIEATVRTIDVDPAKLVALEIFRRHVALGSFHELRKKADEDRGRAKTSAALIFQSMIFDHGKVKQHCAGLVVEDGPEELADTFGLGTSVVWPSLRLLESLEMIRRIRVGRGNDHFEVLMPALDEGQSSHLVRLSKLDCEPASDQDLACTTVQARAPVEARAPVLVPARALGPARAPELAERARPSELAPPARTVVQARAPVLVPARAQPDCDAGIGDACTGARASTGARAPVHVHVPCEEHVHVPAAQVGQGGRERPKRCCEPSRSPSRPSRADRSRPSRWMKAGCARC
jgi:hypothetical protein